MSGRGRALLFAAFGIAAVVATYLAIDRYSTTPEPDTAAYCEQAEALADLDQALGDLDAAAVQDSVAKLERLERAAPSSIRPQVETLRATVAELASTMASAPSGDTQAIEELWRQKAGDVSAIGDAAKAVVAYTTRTCDVDLGGTVPGPAPGTSSVGPDAASDG